MRNPIDIAPLAIVEAHHVARPGLRCTIAIIDQRAAPVAGAPWRRLARARRAWAELHQPTERDLAGWLTSTDGAFVNLLAFPSGDVREAEIRRCEIAAAARRVATGVWTPLATAPAGIGLLLANRIGEALAAGETLTAAIERVGFDPATGREVERERWTTSYLPAASRPGGRLDRAVSVIGQLELWPARRIAA